MFCPNCGKEIKDGTKFCPYCGKPTKAVTAQQTQQAQNINVNPTPAPDSTKPKKKGHKGLIAIIVIIALIVCFGAYGYLRGKSDKTDNASGDAASGDAVSSDAGSGTWNVYVYMCGSNLESGGGAATADINEMIAGTTGENVKVILETGGSKAWDNESLNSDSVTIPADKLGRYIIQDNSIQEIETVDNASMGDENTFADFLNFCKDYPADHEVLLLWDHGGGTFGGCCVDELYGDGLDAAELAGGLHNAGIDHKYDALGFDACLMATYDYANIASGYADYMIASEETEPGSGWEYTSWLGSLSKNSGQSVKAVGKQICDSYYDSFAGDKIQRKVTMSVIDLSKYKNLSTAIEAMGDEVNSVASSQDTNIYTYIAQESGSFERFGTNFEMSDSNKSFNNMVDLNSFISECENYFQSTEPSLSDALKKAVVYERHGEDRRAAGLSVYYPLDHDPDTLKEYVQLYGNSIDSYREMLAYSLGVDPSSLTQGQTLTYDEDNPGFSGSYGLRQTDEGYWVFSISQDDYNNIQDVNHRVYIKKDNEDTYFYLGEDCSYSRYQDQDGSIDYEENFGGKWASIVTGDDVKCLYLSLYQSDDSYNYYLSPIKYNGSDAYLKFRYDMNNGTYEIDSIMLLDDQGNVYDTIAGFQDSDVINVGYVVCDNPTDTSDNMTLYYGNDITWTTDAEIKDMPLNSGYTFYYYFIVNDGKVKSFSRCILMNFDADGNRVNSYKQED